jgi:hypothetical protein
MHVCIILIWFICFCQVYCASLKVSYGYIVIFFWVYDFECTVLCIVQCMYILYYVWWHFTVQSFAFKLTALRSTFLYISIKFPIHLLTFYMALTVHILCTYIHNTTLYIVCFLPYKIIKYHKLFLSLYKLVRNQANNAILTIGQFVKKNVDVCIYPIPICT